ncbi:unnamed protein product [Adineta steineri]|uniref:G-protein coupled receptors family 1 profile domain-containing protein n=1 Tax=Adineta steineri TaxID=433720 RepID=A0A818NY12_9BILA|nr:unnamed protein product [Adineta steineri]CAF3612082.1 unnamed protein product [Adineta steineri]
MLVYILSFGFNINAYTSSVILCKLLNYALYTVSKLPPTVLILASIDRLLLSSQNVNVRLYSSKRLAYFSLSITTAFWMIFYIHTLIEFDFFQLYPSGFKCTYSSSGFYGEFMTVFSLVVNISFSLTLIILSLMAFKNARQLRSIPRQQRHQFRTMNKKDFQLLRCLYVLDIVYISFSLFASIFNVYQASTQDQIRTPLRSAIENFLTRMASFSYHIPFCISFFIFLFVSKAFRQEMKYLMYKICGKDRIGIRERQNVQLHDRRDNKDLNIVINVVSTF